MQIFISYARQDGRALAVRLEEDLKAAGHGVWRDESRLLGGARFGREIEKTIEASPVVLALVTSGFRESVECEGEVRFALSRGKWVIPLLAAPDTELPLNLLGRNYRDFTKQRYEDALAWLLRDLGDLESKAPAGVPRPQRKARTAAAALLAVCGPAALGWALWRFQWLAGLVRAGSVYHATLLGLAIAVSGVVFGLLRRDGARLRVGGPALALGLIAIGGLAAPPSGATFPLTVYIHGVSGREDLPLRSAGRVVLDLSGKQRREPIGANGQAYFPAVPAALRGQEARVWVDADGFECAGGRAVCDWVRRNCICPCKGRRHGWAGVCRTKVAARFAMRKSGSREFRRARTTVARSQ